MLFRIFFSYFQLVSTIQTRYLIFCGSQTTQNKIIIHSFFTFANFEVHRNCIFTLKSQFMYSYCFEFRRFQNNSSLHLFFFNLKSLNFISSYYILFKKEIYEFFFTSNNISLENIKIVKKVHESLAKFKFVIIVYLNCKFIFKITIP